MKLTFYLFNETVDSFEAALRPEKLDGDDAFQEVNFKVALPYETRAFFQKNKQTKPKWLDYLKDYLEIDENDIINTTNSFLLLIKAENRIFGVTQGYGFTAIDRSKLERGFGLKVVLNEIDPEKIKTVDCRKIDTTTKQKRVFLNRISPLYDFDFDMDEELINHLSGYPIDAGLARKLSGADSLSLTADVNFEDIGNKCTNLLESFYKEDYKESFGFIDYLKIVKENDLKNELDEILRQAINDRHIEKLMLAYPDIIDFSQIHQFKVSFERKSSFIEEVTLDSIYSFLSNHNIIDCDPSRLWIIGLDYNDQAVSKKYYLDEFIVFETRIGSNRFLHSLKQWFELDENYVSEVDDAVRCIPFIQVDNYLPSMGHGQREDEFNSFAAAEKQSLLLLDKQNFRLDGHSQVEVCDLLSNSSEFICVKKYNGSSTLSHLFSQGYVSSVLLNDYPSYRSYILSCCPQNFGDLAFSIEDVKRDDITFVFAIACEADRNLVDVLPFFSKVNLRHARRSIERMGFNVKLYKIPYN